MADIDSDAKRMRYKLQDCVMKGGNYLENNNKRLISKQNLLRDEVRNSIQEAILSNELKPGERVIETQWAKELGVSKAPVREAIRELETVGLLENRPFRGSFVRELTNKQIRDANKVRIVLDELSLREAAAHITDSGLEQLREMIREMETAAEKSDYESYIEKNIAFHEKIVEFADNELLLRVWRQSNTTEWTRVITHMSKQSLDRLALRHEDMYEALASHDPERAAEAGIAHYKELDDEIEKEQAAIGK